MSHNIDLSITDCNNIFHIKERLENTMDSEADEEEMTPWVSTLSSILIQATEDGWDVPTKPLMPIPLPYNLRHDELVIHPGDVPADTDFDNNHPMNYLVDKISWNDDEAMELIMRGAVLLYNRADNTDSFTRCLEQSTIWYAG